MNEETWVFIKTEFYGIHQWKECEIQEVSFLKFPHRHKVFVEVHINVTKKNREIEFFILQKQVNDIITKLYGSEQIKNLQNKSMETIASEIKKLLQRKYLQNKMIILCSEDNENGAYIKCL